MTTLKILSRTSKKEKFSGLCALGIMTKAPEAGKVKTRLTPPLTPAEAAELNICFLRDLAASIVVATEQAPARGIGIYTPAGSAVAYEGVLPRSFSLVPQRGDQFGERLLLAVEDLLGIGFESVCLINSDSPTVLPSTFAEAAQELGKAGDRIVLGPSDDGGYYLIGLKKIHYRLFEQIDWSTERVFRQTLERIREIRGTVHLLPYGFDVDDNMTINRLCDELLGPQACQDVAPNTRKFLNDIIQREGRGRIWPS